MKLQSLKGEPLFFVLELKCLVGFKRYEAAARSKPRREPDPNIAMHFSRKLSPEITFQAWETEE